MSSKPLISTTVLTFLIIIGSMLFLFSPYSKDIFEKAIEDKKNSNPGVVVEENDEAVRALKNQKFSSVHKKYSSINSPNINSDEIKSQLNLSNKKVTVEITKSSIDPRVFEINQGDKVEFKNLSPNSVQIVGKENWGSFAKIKPGQSFTQGFDIKGEYNFFISENSNLRGVIVVK